ncbi:hypothetical protein T265_14963, partial [Opisthorchis viverrini]
MYERRELRRDNLPLVYCDFVPVSTTDTTVVNLLRLCIDLNKPQLLQKSEVEQIVGRQLTRSQTNRRPDWHPWFESAHRLLLSRIGKLSSIPTPVLSPGGIAPKHQKGVTAVKSPEENTKVEILPGCPSLDRSPDADHLEPRTFRL